VLALRLLGWMVRALVVPKADLLLENLALRQQLAMFCRDKPKPQARTSDRLFWVLLARSWKKWRRVLTVVQPDTVVRWHRAGFRLYWRWKSCKGSGRPPLADALRALIRHISRQNPLWGAPRIQAELRLLGHDLAQSTVARYMARRSKPPSQTWRTFSSRPADRILRPVLGWLSG
jgi:hypothetical protein